MWRISRSISAARQGFASGSLSPLELMEESLTAAQTVSKLNAFTWMDDKDKLMSKAQESWSRWKRGAPKGMLDGIPVSVKVAITVY